MNISCTVSYVLCDWMYNFFIKRMLCLARIGHRSVHKCEHPKNKSLVVRWEWQTWSVHVKQFGRVAVVIVGTAGDHSGHCDLLKEVSKNKIKNVQNNEGNNITGQF